MYYLSRTLCLVVTVSVVISGLHAEPKPAKPSGPPRILVASPMGVAVGGTTKVVLRGLNLDTATEVRCSALAGNVKLLKKGAAGGIYRSDDIPRWGNTQVEIEVTVPAKYPTSTIMVTVITPTGESNAHLLFVNRSPVVAEKEPNNGFQQAQAITFGQTVAGAIDHGYDVDVFRFEGKAGQRITAEVVAARFGSALDSLLTLYTADGQIVAVNDDLDPTTFDSRIEVTLPRTGTYYLSLTDANDRASPAHVYRLVLQAN